MLKKLYDRCLDLARHKLSKPFLAFISFVESSFFPIPPDVMIVPMVLAKKDEFLKQTAFEHARMMMMFTKDTFEQSLVRANDIMQTLASDPILKTIYELLNTFYYVLISLIL